MHMIKSMGGFFMIYVFNKNKILSYMVASFIVLILFIFSTSIIPNQNVDLLKVSANAINNNFFNNIYELEE